jgi:hypothetical protein
MIRTLLFSTLALTATALPLSAQTPTGPVQSAAQGAVKGTARVKASFRVLDRQAKASLRDLPVWRGAQVKPRSEWQGALERWRQRPAEVCGASLH